MMSARPRLRTQPGNTTARFGATVKPLADGAPFGPGSDRSHDRKGVIFRTSTKPLGHGARARLTAQPRAQPKARPGGRARTRGSAPLWAGGHYSLPAAPLVLTASVRTPVAACLYTGARLGCASNLSQVAMASSFLPAWSWEEASHTKYAGCGSAATAVCRSVMATSHFLRAMNNLPRPACASATSPF